MSFKIMEYFEYMAKTKTRILMIWSESIFVWIQGGFMYPDTGIAYINNLHHNTTIFVDYFDVYYNIINNNKSDIQ